MTQGWSGRRTTEDGRFVRYVFGEGATGQIVDFKLEPELPQASWTYGEGIVHHCAFQVDDYTAQDQVKFRLEGMGFTDTSERKDRGYFDSIYVRTPAGALFEATVSKPAAWPSTSASIRSARAFRSRRRSATAPRSSWPTSSRCTTRVDPPAGERSRQVRIIRAAARSPGARHRLSPLSATAHLPPLGLDVWWIDPSSAAARG